MHRLAVDLDRLEVDRVQVLVEQPQPGLLEPLALVAVGLVRHHDAQHPVGVRLAVDRRLEVGLDLRHACLVLARQVAEEALAGEAPQLGRGALQALRRLEPGQLLVALVDLLDVERLLEAGEVEVVLLVDVGDEPVGLVSECVDLARFGSSPVPRIRPRAEADDRDRTAHAAGRHHGAGARGGPGSGRRGRARLRPAHDRGSDDQRARRPDGRPRLRDGARADRSRGLGLAAHRGGRGERPVAHPGGSDGAAGRDPAPGRASSRSAPGRASSSASSTGRARARCS